MIIQLLGGPSDGLKLNHRPHHGDRILIGGNELRNPMPCYTGLEATKLEKVTLMNYVYWRDALDRTRFHFGGWAAW